MDDYSEKVAQDIDEQVGKWYDDFEKTSAFDALSKSAQDNAWFIISYFSETMYSYNVETPAQWTDLSLEETIGELFPRKVSADQELFSDVEPVLKAFFGYLEEAGHIKNSKVLIKSLKNTAPEMIRQSGDPANWGMAKSFFMGAVKEGIDIDDEQAMNEFMNYVNRQTSVSASSKVGRNEPCPCGSGKKYKKCCGGG